MCAIVGGSDDVWGLFFLAAYHAISLVFLHPTHRFDIHNSLSSLKTSTRLLQLSTSSHWARLFGNGCELTERKKKKRCCSRSDESVPVIVQVPIKREGSNVATSRQTAHHP